ncbi:MAG: TatD family deoxyribonuclease [Thermoprotei archaeon]|nr:MAG: TatD family deoxyribonuclease [Thermoprotei archaeon]
MDKVYVDAHCHLYDFEAKDIEEFLAKNIIIVSVAEDASTSARSLELRRTGRIYACVGIHPWEVEKIDKEAEISKILAYSKKADCIGEVGLDKKFVSHLFSKQKEIFEKMVEIAVSHNLPLNIHAAGAWREVLEVLDEWKAEIAIFHWYTGPLDVLDKIVSRGYFITVNPSIKIQQKMRKIVEHVPLDVILTESDGPYNYRGLLLKPDLVPSTIEAISKIKGVSAERVRETIYNNFKRVFK